MIKHCYWLKRVVQVVTKSTNKLAHFLFTTAFVSKDESKEGFCSLK